MLILNNAMTEHEKNKKKYSYFIVMLFCWLCVIMPIYTLEGSIICFCLSFLLAVACGRQRIRGKLSSEDGQAGGHRRSEAERRGGKGNSL